MLESFYEKLIDNSFRHRMILSNQCIPQSLFSGKYVIRSICPSFWRLPTIESIKPVALCSSDIVVYLWTMSLNGTFNSTLSRASVVRFSKHWVVHSFSALWTRRIWKYRCWTIVLVHRHPNHWARKHRKRRSQRRICRCRSGFTVNCANDANRMDLRAVLVVCHWVTVIRVDTSSVEIVCCKRNNTTIVIRRSILSCVSEWCSLFSMFPLFQIDTHLSDQLQCK